MTREEAISELQKAIDLIKQNGKDWLDERDIPILQMAITALELSDSIMLQLDCKMFHSGVNVEDTISDETTDIIYRQAAIDAALTFLVEYCGAAFDEDMQKMLCERLDALPSAQPKVAKDTNVPINDCISRQAAIDVLHMDTSIIPYEKAREYADVTILEIRNRLEKLPSAQPVVKDVNALINGFISRQAAISAITSHSGVVDKSVAKRILAQLPPVQPEIIRCQDCKHFIELLDEKSAKKFGQEYACECGRLNKPEPDDFCSRPKRKEN